MLLLLLVGVSLCWNFIPFNIIHEFRVLNLCIYMQSKCWYITNVTTIKFLAYFSKSITLYWFIWSCNKVMNFFVLLNEYRSFFYCFNFRNENLTHLLFLFWVPTLSWHTSVCLDNRKTNRNYNLCLNIKSSERSQKPAYLEFFRNL